MKLDDWQILLQEEPENELLRFTVAKRLMDDSHWAEAKNHFQILVTQKPDYALAWAFLARCLLSMGEKTEARAVCEKAMPVAQAQKHEIPLEELQSVLEELDNPF